MDSKKSNSHNSRGRSRSRSRSRERDIQREKRRDSRDRKHEYKRDRENSRGRSKDREFDRKSNAERSDSRDRYKHIKIKEDNKYEKESRINYEKTRSDSRERAKSRHKSNSKNYKELNEEEELNKDNLCKVILPFNSPIIDESDFFLKSLEFRVWLKLLKNLNFEDLSTDEAHTIFNKKFVKDYNKGILPEMYYTGEIPEDIKKLCRKTAYNWNIKTTNEK